jgi:hypothetical protein
MKNPEIFGDGIIVLGDQPVSEKYKDFLKVV